TFTYQPNADYSGSDSFVMRFTDAGGASIAQTYTVQVNDAPVLASSNLYVTAAHTVANTASIAWNQPVAHTDGTHAFFWVEQTGTNWEIHGQLYNAAHQTIGSVLKINPDTDSTGQFSGSKSFATATPDGGYIVTWYSDAGTQDIYMRKISSSGQLGTVYQVNNTGQSALQDSPNIVSLGDINADQVNDYAIIWNDQTSSNYGHTKFKIMSETGTTIVAETQLPLPTTTPGVTPAWQIPWDILALSNGNIAISTSVLNIGNTWDNALHILTPSGTAAIPAFNFATTTTGNQFRGEMAQLGNGNILITWQGVAMDGDAGGIYGTIVSTSGTVVKSEFLINTTIAGDQTLPDIALLSDGSSVVVWRDGNDVAGQRLDASGNAIGSEFKVTAASSVENRPAVEAFPDGRFVVTWEDFTTTTKNLEARMFSINGATTPNVIVDYACSGNAVKPFELVTLSDTDDTNLSKAVVTIQGFTNGDPDLLAFGTAGSHTNITGSFDATTGIFSLSGSATLAEYQAAIADIQFSGANVIETRTLTLQVTDDSGTTSDVTSSIINVITTDPIILDLNGDGVNLISTAQGVDFDLDADGDKERIGWFSSDDGVLALDISGDGQINDMSEIISSYFNYQDRNDSEVIQSSLEILSLYDDNEDGIIDQQDDIFDKLSVWQDANTNGLTESGELKSMDEAGIQSINLNHQDLDTMVEGNHVSKSGQFVFDNGSHAEWQEVSFDLASPSPDQQNLSGQPDSYSITSPVNDPNLVVAAD
ncbi:MAG: hypothetical protein R3261_05590, partial [Alphaproteobacteria bacterium]|nr:hypothetical protein [Alphaproteobacteria bacterium]